MLEILESAEVLNEQELKRDEALMLQARAIIEAGGSLGDLRELDYQFYMKHAGTCPTLVTPTVAWPHYLIFGDPRSIC